MKKKKEEEGGHAWGDLKNWKTKYFCSSSFLSPLRRYLVYQLAGLLFSSDRVIDWNKKK
jgi:hypothetical protein